MNTEPTSTDSPPKAPGDRPQPAQHSVLREFRQRQRTRTLLLSALRAVFVVLVVATVALTLSSAPESAQYFPLESIAGTLIAALAAAFLVIIADIMTPKKDLASVLAVYLGVSFGLVASLGLAALIDVIAEAWELKDGQTRIYLGLIKGIGGLCLIYLSVSIVLSTRDDFRLIIPYVQFEKRAQGTIPLVIDTSTLIDGRLLELAKTGMVDAPIVIPRYVIDELQSLSDSRDRLKREKGRRGLDLVQALQEVYPETKLVDAPGGDDDVDRRLLDTAELEGYRIVTTDLGLTKIARIKGLPVLNLNEVTGALRGNMVPGMRVETTIIRAGEERDQGIAYLPDGAMIVVERGEALIGTSCEVEITNVIQRSGGKLVFGKPVRSGEPGESGESGGSGESGESGESGRTAPRRTLAESATTQPPAPRPDPASGGGGGAKRNPRRGR